MLLCKKTDQKGIDDYLFQFNNAPLYLDRREAIMKFSEVQKENPDAKNALIKAMDDPFWAIRDLAISKINIGQADKQIIEKLKLLAKDDPSSHVRATAVGIIAGLEDTAHVAFLRSCVNDSSYNVVASVLRNVNELDADSGLKLAEELEGETNSGMISAISGIYAKSKASNKQPYFEKMLDETRSMSRYSLLSNYGDYLSNSESSVILVGLETLKTVAINDNEWWIRHSATNAISRIKEELESQIVELKKETKDRKAMNDALALDTGRNIENLTHTVANLDKSLKEIKDAEENDQLNNIYESD